MDALNLDYTIKTSKPFSEALAAVEKAVADNGFRVLHVHNVQATFAEKGVTIDPYSIVEVCNVKFARQALAQDPLIGLMMPCKINVFVQGGETQVSLLRPQLLSTFFPGKGLETLAADVETILRRVVEAAR